MRKRAELTDEGRDVLKMLDELEAYYPDESSSFTTHVILSWATGYWEDGGMTFESFGGVPDEGAFVMATNERCDPDSEMNLTLDDAPRVKQLIDWGWISIKEVEQ